MFCSAKGEVEWRRWNVGIHITKAVDDQCISIRHRIVERRVAILQFPFVRSWTKSFVLVNDSKQRNGQHQRQGLAWWKHWTDADAISFTSWALLTKSAPGWKEACSQANYLGRNNIRQRHALGRDESDPATRADKGHTLVLLQSWLNHGSISWQH
jgi:hypothetical protein